MSKGYRADPNLVTHIYTLSDPRTGEIRYVGKTIQPPALRLTEHLRRQGANHRTHWIESLLAAGVRPILTMVETVIGAGWPARERFWIAHYRAQGYQLVNGTDGGEGCPGRVLTAEHKARIGAANSRPRIARIPVLCAFCGVLFEVLPHRYQHSGSGRFYCCKGHKTADEFRSGRRGPVSAETRVRMSLAGRGRHHTETAKAKIGQASRGKTLSAVSKAKISAANSGRKRSEETRAKLREAWKRRKAKALQVVY